MFAKAKLTLVEQSVRLRRLLYNLGLKMQFVFFESGIKNRELYSRY
jgi:hypothetical protein